MPYSAGSIFVSVVPSFKDNQRDIAREYRRRGEEASKEFSEGFDKQVQRDLPKAMEKAARGTRQAQGESGKEAGKNYSSEFRKALVDGLKSAEKDLDRLQGNDRLIEVPVGVDKEKFLRDFGALVRNVNLTRADLEVGADVGQAIYDVDRLKAKLASLRDASVNPEVRSNLTAGLGALDTATTRARRSANLDVQPEPQQQVKPDIGAYNEGLRSRLAQSLTTLPPIPLDVDPTSAQRKIIEFRTDAFNLIGDLETDIYLDEGDTLARTRALMALLEGVVETADPEVEIGSSFNAAGALAQLKRWESAVDPIEVPIVPEMGFFRRRVAEQLKKAGTALPEIPIDADTTEARQRLAEIRAELMGLGEEVKIGLDLDEARSKALALQRELGALRRENVEIDVDVDAARAIIELRAIDAAARDADDSLSSAGRSGDDGANAFRAFSGRILGIAAVGPLAIPVVGALAGAIGATGPLAVAGAAGLGVFALGLMGVSDAVKAMGAAQDNAAKDNKSYADGVRSASRSLRDAETSVADARRSAADSAVSARERVQAAIEREQDAVADVARAEKGYTDALKDSQRAQEGVNDARKAAADRLEDLQLRLRGGALDETQAQQDLIEAQVAYSNIMEDAQATDRERQQAILRLEQQRLKVDEVALANERLAEEQAEAARTGVEGSREVTAAQDKVAQANEAAQRAAEAVASAERSAADARADIAKAQSDQQRAAAEIARQIESAQLRLADAQVDYAEAIAATSASQDTLAESLAKMSPAGRDFAAYIFSLRGYVSELQDAAAGGLLPGLTDFLDGVITAKGPQFVSIVSGMSGALGDMFRGFGESLQGEQFSAFFDMIESRGPTFIGQIGQALTNLGEGTASLLTAFAPSAEDFGNSIVAATERFSNWAAGLSETEGFQQFLEWWQTNGPVVVDFIQAFAGAVINLGVALAPYAIDLMQLVTGILDFIAAADPQTLGDIAVAMTVLAIAFQSLVGIRAIFAGIATVATLATGALAVFNGTAIGTSAILTGIGGIVAIVVAALAILGLGIYLLWQNSETFRDIVTTSWAAIQAAVGVVVDWFMAHVWPVMEAVFTQIGEIVDWLWTNILQPAFEAIAANWAVVMDLLEYAWEKVGRPIFDTFMSIVEAVWSVLSPIFQLIGIAFGALGSLIAWYWDTVVGPVFRAFMDAGTWLWENVLGPVFRFIIGGFGVLVGYLASAWETVGAPVFALFAAVLEGLVAVFAGTKADVEAIWSALLDILMAPIVFVVETVLNQGLIAGINWVAGLFTDDDHWIPDIPTDWIPGRAMGGPIPGSSPSKRADNIPIMATAGEYMQQVDAVDYYGVGVMDALNRRLIPRELFTGDVQGRAYGGPIDRALGQHVLNRFPQARITSAYRPGDSGYHGRGMAVDIGGAIPYPNATGKRQMLEIDQWLASTMGTGLAELIHTAPGAINLRNGAPHVYNAATQAEHMNHVHAAIQSVAALAAGGGSFAKGVLNDTSIFGQLTDFMDSPVDFLKGIVTDFAGDSLSSRVGQALIEIPFGFAEDVVDSLMDLVGLDGGEISGVKPIYGTVDGSGDVHDVVRQAAGQYGWGDGAQWSALDWIISRESGWNPSAQNPTSTASGLFQHINGTWNAYKAPGVTATRMRDAGVPQQAQAGMNYIRSRYGTPVGAQSFWGRNGWYADGGLIESLATAGITPKLHDQGGVIDPGWNLLYNGLREPEHSFNPQQLDNIQTIAEQGGSGSGFMFGQGANFYGYDPTELMEAARREHSTAQVVADLAGAGMNL